MVESAATAAAGDERRRPAVDADAVSSIPMATSAIEANIAAIFFMHPSS
jgi:hypothetical protein